MTALFWLIAEIPWASSATFYDLISHELLVLIFSPLFLLPLLILLIGLAKYWRTVNGESITWSQLRESLRSAATLNNLDGGVSDIYTAFKLKSKLETECVKAPEEM